MAILQISDVIAKAQRERAAQAQYLTNLRQQLTCEDFKTLFLHRAQQVMMEHKSIGEFVIDDQNKAVLNLMYYYTVRHNLDQINPLAGIILNGKYGCGKSVMMSAFCRVLNDLAYDKSDRITEVHSIELAENIRANGVTPYARQPLLIQDLGKEAEVMNDFGTKINPISNLLAVRSEYGALTFGSTNMTEESFGVKYKEFIKERITEHVNLIQLTGNSRRPDYSINQPGK